MHNYDFGAKSEDKQNLSWQAGERQVGKHGHALPFPQQTQVDQVVCRLGDKSCAAAHASALNSATASRPSLSRQSLLRLQQQYGNRYVQRVLGLSRKGEGEAALAPEIEHTILQSRGGGQALDGKVCAQMESAFSVDFGGVRVHTGTEADTLNRSLNARAFTVGQDIYFRQGAYSPGSSDGRKLLAHELTHVVQQGGATVQGGLVVGQAGDIYEQEADQVAEQVHAMQS